MLFCYNIKKGSLKPLNCVIRREMIINYYYYYYYYNNNNLLSGMRNNVVKLEILRKYGILCNNLQTIIMNHKRVNIFLGKEK